MTRIGLDVDGVLANFNTAFEVLLADTTGKDLVPIQYKGAPPCWDWPEFWGYSTNEVEAAWDQVHLSNDFWYRLLPYPETPAILQRLYDLECRNGRPTEVFFITSRTGETARLQTEAWLEQLGYHQPTVLISSRKEALAQGLALSKMLDDKIRNCERMPRTVRTYILDRPWNRAGTPSGVTRVKSVLEAL